MKFTVKELIEELLCYEDDKVVWIHMDNMQAPVRVVDLDEDGDDRLILK
jgi:hypothetical protein